MGIKLPHMPLWVYDLDTDRDCRRMSDAQFGRYMRLMIRQWIEGSVPATPTEAIRDAMLDPGSEGDIQSLLDRKFSDKVEAGRGNPKLAQVRQECLAKVETNRANGKKGGRPSKTDRITEGLSEKKPDGSIRAYGSGSGSESGSTKKKKESDRFDEFWQGVPNKIGKGAARKAYASAIKGGATHDEIIAGLPGYAAYEQRRRGQSEYRPLHPATWLNGERWTDEHGTAKQQASAAFGQLGDERHKELFEEVQQAEPNVAHSAGNIDTQRAMRRLAKQKGWI